MPSIPSGVAANMKRLAATGAIGCNFEDQVVGGDGLHPIEVQAERIARRAGGGRARFLHQRPHRHLPQGQGRDA